MRPDETVRVVTCNGQELVGIFSPPSPAASAWRSRGVRAYNVRDGVVLQSVRVER